HDVRAVARHQSLEAPREPQIVDRGVVATACSAAAMYSAPSGSILKNGPRPNRSLGETSRAIRTLIRLPGGAVASYDEARSRQLATGDARQRRGAGPAFRRPRPEFPGAR